MNRAPGPFPGATLVTFDAAHETSAGSLAQNGTIPLRDFREEATSRAKPPDLLPALA